MAGGSQSEGVSDMTERPILFSGPMVRAILDGQKTQTRRVVKPHPSDDCFVVYELSMGEQWPYRSDEDGSGFVGDMEIPLKCPYGMHGDRLWVRESWSDRGDNNVAYRATNNVRMAGEKEYVRLMEQGTQWKPSIHMPRWASRITLEVTGIRVEKLNDMPSHDHVKEGFEDFSSFADLWQSVNAGRGFGWDKNPWVWVVDFVKR